MNFQQISAFINLVKYRSFSVTAEKMFLSQSSISKYILSLEKELGEKLFIRSGKSVELSELGQVLLPSLERLNEQYTGMLNLCSEYLNHKKCVLRIATLPVIAQYGLSEKLSRFCGEHASIGVKITEIESADIGQKIETNACDFAFVRAETIDYSQWNSVFLCEDRLICAMPRGHALEKRGSISLADLRNQPMVLLDDRAGILNRLVAPCLRLGFMPNVVHTTTRLESLISLLENHQGISVLFEKTISYFHPEHISLLPLSPVISSWICLAWRKDLPLTLEKKEFIRYFRLLAHSTEPFMN